MDLFFETLRDVFHWMVRNPFWTVFLILPIGVFLLTILGFRRPFALNAKTANRSEGVRFAKEFCIWLALSFSAICGVFKSTVYVIMGALFLFFFLIFWVYEIARARNNNEL